MKITQRLDYNRLAEVLAERNMVEPAAIHELLNASNEGGQAFPEALVASNLVSDWDLSRVVCEIFQLPFLPLDFIKPRDGLLELFDANFLHSSGLVPLARFGNVLTLAMPALVPADVLAMLAAETDMVLLPVVGTVTTNRKWLKENVEIKKVSETDTSWGNVFDEGEAAVQETFTTETSDLDVAVDDDASLLDSLDDMSESLEFTDSDDELEVGLDDVASLTDMSDEEADALEFTDLDGDEEASASLGEDTGGSTELPPMPDFE